MISEKALRRLAEPSSPLHSDYLSYRNQEIGWDELVARLPHVALIGDSVCTGVYMSSIWSTFWRARTCRGNNWFLDTNPAPSGIQSVWKRLEEFSPFVAIECAGIGARSITKVNRRIFSEEFFGHAISRDKLVTCWR